MNTDGLIIIGKLKNRIQEIISRYELAVSDNRSLKEELAVCKNDLESKNLKIKELEKKIEEAQLVGAFTASSVEAKDAKKKIGKLIKEIDKCISLLNN